MKFWASFEAFKPAFDSLAEVELSIEAYLNAEFANSVLAKLDCKIRYIPIVMPEGMKERYPERSKLRKKASLYDCAPKLDYKVFVEGSFEDQLKEYIRGISLSAPYLADLGATREHIDEFNSILRNAIEKITVYRPDQSRH